MAQRFRVVSMVSKRHRKRVPSKNQHKLLVSLDFFMHALSFVGPSSKWGLIGHRGLYSLPEFWDLSYLLWFDHFRANNLVCTFSSQWLQKVSLGSPTNLRGLQIPALSVVARRKKQRKVLHMDASFPAWMGFPLVFS